MCRSEKESHIEILIHGIEYTQTRVRKNEMDEKCYIDKGRILDEMLTAFQSTTFFLLKEIMKFNSSGSRGVKVNSLSHISFLMFAYFVYGWLLRFWIFS